MGIYEYKLKQRELRKKIEDLQSFENIYNMYFEKIKAISLNLFKFKNMPSNLHEHEIVESLFSKGFCVIANPYLKNKKLDIAVLENSSLYGVTPYVDEFDKVTFANPIWDSREYKKDEFVCIRCGYNYMIIDEFISQFAMLLTDIHISMSMCVVNTRAFEVFTCENEIQKKSFEKFYSNLRIGKFSVIDGNNILEKVNNIPKSTTNNATISELINAYSNTWRMIFKTFGLNYSKEKAESVLSDESNSDEPSLRAFIDCIFSTLETGIEEVNKKFDCNIKVDYNNRLFVNKETTINDMIGEDENESNGNLPNTEKTEQKDDE